MATLNMVNAGNSNLRVKLVTKSGTGIVAVDPENPTAAVQGLEFTCCMASNENWCEALAQSYWDVPLYLTNDDPSYYLPVGTLAVFYNGTRHNVVIGPETSFLNLLNTLVLDYGVQIKWLSNDINYAIYPITAGCQLIEIPSLGIMIPLNGYDGPS